jgi:outer membrane protein
VLAGGTFTPSVSIPTYDQAIARALMLRPDYYAAVQSVEGFEASLRAAKLGLFPTLNGSASAGTASTDPGGGTFRNASSVGLTLSIPIYDGGVTAAQVMQVQGQLDQASASLQSTKLNVQLNVKQTLVNLVAARGAFDQTQAELSKAQEVLKATQAQYRAGVTTLPLLLNAQVGITQALTDQVTALYTLRQAEAAFSFAEGANAPA